MTSNLPDINLNLRGKTALVTGGSNETGIGICRALALAGASVIIHYNKNRDLAEQACKDIISAGGTAVSYGADLSDENSVDLLFNFIRQRFGSLDVLVNNAHIPLKRTFFGNVTWEEHQEQIDVMVKGTFYCSKKSIEIMSKRRCGSIVNIITSQTEHPVRGYSSYVTAASSLTGFIRNLAVEAGCSGIRVNMVAPNFVLTRQTPNAPQHVHEAIVKSTPLGRLATPRDIANAALFFASDLSEFITGCYLVVDGGYSLSGSP